MSASEIASVLADLTSHDKRRVVSALAEDHELYALAKGLIAEPTVIDATPIYLSLLESSQEVYLYEDHPCIAPPWDEGAICYLNQHGNVIIMHASVANKMVPWETSEPIDWSMVRWRLAVFVWVGGRGGDGPIATFGPVMLWRIAIAHDGQPLDIGWVNLQPEYDIKHWDMASLVLLGALNFLNCRNILLVEPTRPRAERRRLEPFGVKVHELNILPVGRTMQGHDPVKGLGVPLTSVRGHFARYGIEGRGLLFGRYAGRFWIPQHARGTAELGEVRKTYRLNPA